LFVQRRSVQDRGELCLAEEVERLRQLGLSDEEVAGRLGVDVSWVESLVSPEDEETERRA
jgi:predicted transposase YdaD